MLVAKKTAKDTISKVMTAMKSRFMTRMETSDLKGNAPAAIYETNGVA
jgi:hypothetical protein